MQYSDVTTALALLAEQNDANGVYSFTQSPDFTTYLPTIILFAETACYREVCPLAARSGISSGAVTAGTRTFTLSALSPVPLVVEGLALITPAGQSPFAGDRWTYRKSTLDMIDFIWPFEATTQAPGAAWPETYWAYKDALSIVIAPTPDNAYTAEVTGTIRPATLSASNTTTYLSLYYPDLFIKKCMVETAGMLRDYGLEGVDPQRAVSWEQMYQAAKASAIEEETRRRGVTPGSGSLPITADPIAMPPMPGIRR